MKALKQILTSVMLGCTIFVLSGMIYDLTNEGRFVLEQWGFTKMAVGSIIIGVGYSFPAGVYENERLSQPAKILIHMGIGCVVMLLTAYAVGWLPVELGLAAVLGVIVAMLVVSFLIWLVFYAYAVHEAKKLNQKIRERKNL